MGEPATVRGAEWLPVVGVVALLTGLGDSAKGGAVGVVEPVLPSIDRNYCAADVFCILRVRGSAEALRTDAGRR
jgi:hypothetical protein